MIIYATFFGFVYIVIGTILDAKFSESNDINILYIISWMPATIIGYSLMLIKYIARRIL